MKTLVIGASRGIGHEFARQCHAAGEQVTATARHADDLAALRALGVKALALDVARAESVAGLAWQVDGEAFDQVLFCAGVYGPRQSGLEPPTEADFDTVMRSNVLGAMQVMPQLLDALAPGARVALLSSRMGSIGARSNTAGWLYRASKAALNSVLKDLSLHLSGRATCVALHPGWVRTDMGGSGAELTAEHSVTDLRHLLQRLTPADNGRFLNHDGIEIPW